MMLHSSCNLLNFIRNVTCRYHADQSCIFHIGLSKRHASILIMPKYDTRYKVYTLINPQKIVANKKTLQYEDYRWIRTTRFLSDDVKSKDKSDNETKLVENVQQRIIELNEEKLGKLKERVLNIEPISTIDEKEEGKEEATKLAVKQSTESKESSKDDATSKKAKKKIKADKSTFSLERNFITPVKAMSDFLLKPTDLETLPKTKRRSPYEFEPPITVYWRKDVEAKALEVWGSQEALLKELLKKEVERKIYQQNVFTVKRRLRDYRREIGNKTEIVQKEGLFGRSGKVVLTAIAINASNFLCKLIAWLYTGSHSMFSECVHSAADTCNQLILAYGIHKSVQNPNPDHPYGYTNMKYVSSLISGVGIFCVGTGLSIYHGIHGLLFPAPSDSFFWAFFVLGGSLLSEGATLMMALHSIKRGAEEKKESLKQFVLEGQDPSVNVVLMEDFAAVLGVIVAAGCMGLTSYLENSVFDAVGSLLVGGLLGGVASFIIYSNVAALIGRSISQENLDKINAELEADIMVRAIHDVKGIDMGNNLVRYKAELDFDGRELTRSYLDKHDLIAMLEEVKNMQNIDELEAFLLKHGENIVDMLGGEIDRIELKLKKSHPEIRHCDLEIL
ncbi:proton-coupled zinc antiporter SLC30A9, mitochondrial [Linepithema humile]|uniref:proton-coupled zinc antiporter SLC30A9, mitochondrial n=1 Tax=Linepithema humile TaxID=83485 RepID=UPI0006234C00|nr:PREDICTED: zinc transporter 9 [Linepithema humile]XP_012227234.1 PREDICTED: zinc transporter 9 [Linepithema humile]XP_012227235.1 PREDICTED: zinc transporter 9 [Linepithema humile]